MDKCTMCAGGPEPTNSEHEFEEYGQNRISEGKVPVCAAMYSTKAAELLADYPRPAPPVSGSPAGLLNHAAEYGAWCGKRDAQAAGWQRWYRNGRGGRP